MSNYKLAFVLFLSVLVPKFSPAQNFIEVLLEQIGAKIDEEKQGFYINEDNQAGSYVSDNELAEPWIYTATEDWMSYLPDSLKLKEISIPGTHDSGAKHGSSFFITKPFAQTQSWAVNEQLKAGIRYLDIRCRPVKSSFAIHHGPFYQNQMFGDIMNEITAFLASHPNEVIVMRLKEEHDPEKDSESFETIWNKYVQLYGSYIFQGSSSNATLGDARGKIFVMCQAGCSGYGMNYDYDSEIQDLYEIKGGGPYEFLALDTKERPAVIKSKNNSINRYIDSANTSQFWTINHLSGTGVPFASPKNVANGTNKTTYDYLETIPNKRNLGVVIMDFPGERLIYRIIKSNFTLSKECNCPPKTYRSVSDYTWVEFRLPAGDPRQTINIKNGAYSKYVFPKCNRVWWTDLKFKCNAAIGTWERVLGNWDADAWCNGGPGSSPYVQTGVR